MVKYLILLIIIACVALLYPFRDLYIREDPFSTEYILVSKGFWTSEACREAAKAQNAEDFRCKERTMFGSMMGASSRYSQAGFRAAD